MIRLILQTQGRLGGFSVLSHLLSPKVKSTLLSIYDLLSAVGAMGNQDIECPVCAHCECVMNSFVETFPPFLLYLHEDFA